MARRRGCGEQDRPGETSATGVLGNDDSQTGTSSSLHTSIRQSPALTPTTSLEAAPLIDGDDPVALLNVGTPDSVPEVHPALSGIVTAPPALAGPRTREALLRAGRDLSRAVARGEETRVLIDRVTTLLGKAGGYGSLYFVAGDGRPVMEAVDNTFLSFPVDVNGHRHGLLVVIPDPARPPEEDEKQLLEECADDIALAFHREHLERARQETLLRLIESEERFRQVFHQTNDAILLYGVDLAGRAHICLEANDQACRWFGYSREELRQRYPGDLIQSHTVSGPPPWDRPEPGPYQFDALIRRRDDGMMTAAISLHRFNLLGQQVMLLVARDVTEERRLETKQATSLEQIQQNMEQFQILNDQIRNPVQVIIGLADLEGGEFSCQIIRQAREIDQIVRQLDVGWLESAKVSSYLRRYDT